MLAAEPEATAERRAELMIEAKSQVRTPVLYFDATFSVSKSITLLHASALANAAAGRAAGPGDGWHWQQAAAEVWECDAGGEPRRRWSTCSVRPGTPGLGIRPGGRWEDAAHWVIASFRSTPAGTVTRSYTFTT